MLAALKVAKRLDKYGIGFRGAHLANEVCTQGGQQGQGLRERQAVLVLPASAPLLAIAARPR